MAKAAVAAKAKLLKANKNKMLAAPVPVLLRTRAGIDCTDEIDFMRRVHLSVPLIVLAFPGSILAQTPLIPLAPAAKISRIDKSAQKTTAPAAAQPNVGADQPATAPAESPRLQKLKQLQFDRRPSAILRAWAPAPAEEPKDPKTKPDPIDIELGEFRRLVTLGKWQEVREYLACLPDEEAKAGYLQMLRSLQGPSAPDPQVAAMMMQGMQPMMQYMERNRFNPDDLVGLAAAAPLGLDRDALSALGGVARQVIAGGTVVENAVARLKAESVKPSGAALSVRQAAQVLAGADQAADIGPFLPTLEKAQSDKDLVALNLLARHFLGLHAKENKLVYLEKAWTATQATLATAGPRVDQEEALKRAVELAPKLKAELGQNWLEKSFTDKPERGMDILATIGSIAAQGMQTQPFNTDHRLKALELQKTAVDALLKAAPPRAKEWQHVVTLLASNWLKEADFSYLHGRGSGAARMRRDRWGNIYFFNDDDDGMMRNPYMVQNRNQPQAITVVDVLKARPENDWLQVVRADLRPKLAMTLCQLHLKADEEVKAFPYIEQLATSNQKQARELVNEFLRVWTRNHDPNAARAYTNPYMFMYGFERRADGIPLTRSKQERNLIDLADWVARLRKLPVGDPDEELLAKAFTSCHSNAEVYRMEAIEKVFGPVGGLKPKTLSGLAQQMRENLAGLWRQPEEQKDKKTNRKTKDIQNEVLRGYGVARSVVDQALQKFPDDWALVLAKAAILHDETGFQQEVGKSTQFAPRRSEAYAEFQRAAKLYAGKVADLTDDQQSTKIYEQWFYASLGACDLGQINEEKLPDPRQPALIHKSIMSLPGEAAENHRSKFANLLFTRMSAAKPAVKFRYLKGGFEIVGEHPQATEAKKVFDYYKDLVREIKLETVIDGSATVGHTQPFGLFVFLRHTREIERESGGFGRYLQNQNTNTYYSYNYGRPTADYRDKFQAAATEALKEHFDVLSVTFETDKVHSRATTEYGWRVTPYAYMLLKPRGPQVDKIAPMRIDLDFLDTSGYVVLPIESAALPVDAKPAQAEPRPARKLTITQTLDERQAAQGKLLLEIKATALGLVPELQDILNLAPDGFDIVKTDDQGVSVSKFDQESDSISVASERTWLVTLNAKPDLPRAPQFFQFGQAKDDEATVHYQRYQDADLATVEPVIALDAEYGRRKWRWLWWSGGAGILALVLGVLALRRLCRPRSLEDNGWKLPDPLTPFSAIGLLERIRHEGRLTEGQREELHHSIQRLERHYFAAHQNGDAAGNGLVDLKDITQGWLRRVQ